MILTGDSVLRDHAVVTLGDRVEEVVPAQSLPPGAEIIDLRGRYLSPGFIDLQVNGGNDVLFNDIPSSVGAARIRDGHLQFGTTDIVPTLITTSRERMLLAVAAVSTPGWTAAHGILGVHFEGPAISPERPGVHDPKWIRSDPAELIEVLGGLPATPCLVTLAPETVPIQLISDLHALGLRVSIGHSRASFDRVVEAADAGAMAGTHVWNAMDPITSRDPATVGGLLADDRYFCTFIADGFHVAFETLAISIRTKPTGKAVLVSDAMCPVGGKAQQFRLGGHEVHVTEGRCVTESGVLAGSALDLASAVRNCVRYVGLSLDEAVRMATLYPARLLGIDEEYGRIAPDYRARFAVFDTEVVVSAVVLDGVHRELPSVV